jgi:hypothetical protein
MHGNSAPGYSLANMHYNDNWVVLSESGLFQFLIPFCISGIRNGSDYNLFIVLLLKIYFYRNKTLLFCSPLLVQVSVTIICMSASRGSLTNETNCNFLPDKNKITVTSIEKIYLVIFFLVNK